METQIKEQVRNLETAINQKYVIVKNITRGQAGFSDHRNSPVMLGPLGSKNDSIKIILSESELPRVANHYIPYRKGAQFAVSFSDGIDDNIPQSESKMTVVSTAGVDQALSNRVQFMRDKVKRETDTQKSIDARLIRARAMNTIAENSEKVVLTNKSGAADAVAAAKQAVAIAAADKPARAPMGDVSKDEGIELTRENLGKMAKPELFEIATKMGMVIRPSASRGGVINAILLAIDSKKA